MKEYGRETSTSEDLRFAAANFIIMAGIISLTRMGFPFATESPFLFAVYHLDRYPPGNSQMGIDAKLLRGHSIGADFGHSDGWNMYHGSEGMLAHNVHKP